MLSVRRSTPGRTQSEGRATFVASPKFSELCQVPLRANSAHQSGVRIRLQWLLLLATLAFPSSSVCEAQDDSNLQLSVRTRVEVEPGSDCWHAITSEVAWKPAETCIVVCDMWDDHWCRSSSQRVSEMAPRMNRVLTAAREQGVFIIHCPSDTLDFYKDFPQRKLAQAAPVVETTIPLERWCHIDPEHEGPALPIDDSDDGCDARDSGPERRVWNRQHPAIDIAASDAITDSAEALYLMKQRGIRNVIVMGVHTNFCVLGRPFGIRQLVKQGQNVVLMRDMTDTMYNPERSPFVSHFTGTDLVVEHIERHWCPTITSSEFLDEPEFRFAADTRSHVVIVMSEPEYKTEVSLSAFARTELGRDYRVSLVYGDAKDGSVLPGLDVMPSADLMILSVRRRTLPPEQLQLVRDYLASGKPLLGIRTANHAFCLRDGSIPEGRAAWPEFDDDVIGGSYTNHHGEGPETVIAATNAQSAAHPILHGVKLDELIGKGSLYKVSPLQDSAVAILSGTIPNQPTEPIAWINRRADGGSTFYTSLGHTGDFEQPAFRTLLLNACRYLTQQTP